MNDQPWSDHPARVRTWKMSWADVRLSLVLPHPDLAGILSKLTGVDLFPAPAGIEPADIVVQGASTGGFVIIAGIARFEVSRRVDLWLRVLSLIGSLLLGRTQQLIVHAGAIQSEAGALLFCGPSYVGKSTLGVHAWQAGLTVLGDDRLAYHSETAAVSAFPKPLKPRVSPGSVTPECSGSTANQFVGRLENEDHRVLARAVPGITPVDVWVPVHRVYFLERSGTTTSDLRPLTAAEALPRWLNQMMLSRSGSPLSSLQALEDWATNGRVYVLRVGECDTEAALQLMLKAS